MLEKHTLLKLMWFVTECIVVVLALQLHAPTNTYEAKIRNFERVDRQNPPAKGAVLFIGSSSVEAWDTLAQDFPELTVINRGIGGFRLAQTIYYLDLIVLPYRPSMIILYAGENDLIKGTSPQRVFADYQEFVRRVRQKLPATPIAFISIKPSPKRQYLMPSMEAANEMIKAYAAEHAGLSYIDVYTPMLGVDGQPCPELFRPDGFHLSDEGYRLWRDAVAPYLNATSHVPSSPPSCVNISAVLDR